jgi:hypothetical protein
VLFIPVLFSSVSVDFVHAGFGITPPYVRNTSLIRNSTYEQQILLVRGEANEAQKAEIIIDAPEIESWIEIVEGAAIPMPRGEQKVPMTVRVTVPDDAEFKNYKGAIRIRTVADDGQVTSGAVNISLGARVDIDLDVIDKVIKDFRVRRISVGELNEGKKFAWLFFPGKINFEMLIENTGNIEIAPSEVKFRIFERTGKVLLEETDNIGKMDKILPYATSITNAEIPTRLPSGSYLVRYQIFNDQDIKQEGELSLTISPAGTLQTAGFGFIGLSLAHKISILLPIFSIIIASLYVVRSKRRTRRTRQ